MLQILAQAAQQTEPGDKVGALVWLLIIGVLLAMLVAGFRAADRFTKVIVVLAVIAMGVVIFVGWRAIF